MRFLLLTFATATLLPTSYAAAEETARAEPEPATLASIGLFAGVGGGHDDIYTSAITGARLGAHITPSNWINVSVGRGSFLFDDGYAQIGGSVWELETSLAHTTCSRGARVDICAVPTVGVGYQSGWAEFADGLVMDDPWSETTSRPFATARLGGRAIIGGHVGLELALGARVAPSVWESGGIVVGMSATAGIDASF